ncbi:fibronectin type III domain-containing protein [Flagellimonas lutimaris]|uniref:fibronectin type III domain-containing protein n=1 Tax=Flagellimonas lutimaris TaxID=475082 RepID=UPI003F5CDCB2
MMKKNTFLLISFLVLVFHCQGQKKEGYDNSLLEQLPHHIKLSWETSPDHSQAVTWRTRSSASKNYIEYAEATASPFFEERTIKIGATTQSYTSDDGLWYYHTVNLRNLKPNTQYSYRVGNKDHWSEWSEFKTATGQNEPFKFLYFGDVQRYIHSLGSRTLRQAVLANPDSKFMLFAGDMVHRGGLNKENWNEFFPAGGWMFNNIPIIATPGNHEHLKASSGVDISPLWANTFAFPKNGPKGHEEETFYVDYNNIRVISLNLNRYKYPEDRREILEWTEERLKEYEGDWIFITHHHAMRGLARNRDSGVRFPEFQTLYEKYKVPLVLTGHEHLYARGRMVMDFPIHVVSVAGPYQNAIQFSDWIERAGTSMQLYQEIYVSENKLRYVARTVLGEVYDAFTITKNENGEMQFEEAPDLPAESLIPTKDFEKRYDKELVKTYEADKAKYLQRKNR